jgi:zinc D-Ala-D-Ala carboxypeptidase
MAKFYHQEFACHHCGVNKIQADFLDKLNALGARLPFPVVVTSGYRCPEHNMKVSTTGPTGPHTTGRAADLAVRGKEAVRLLDEALASGEFSGFGIQQKGAVRFIHLDDLKEGRPTIWSY